MNLAVYIHWPFCLSKCPYCDFNSHVAASIDHAAWRAAYKKEIEHYAALLPGRTVTSVFFGGGTPSLMEAATVDGILADVRKHWHFSNNVEITLEANPTSVEAGKFRDFHAAGVNRLSLGIQSLRDDALKFLGRKHDVKQAQGAIELATETFPRFSFDLIYARQGQTPSDWKQELSEALALAGDHLSLYQLTIEPNTQFYTLANRGEALTAPDADAAAMFEMTQDIMAAAGRPAYEISNHAKPGHESRHNLAYWHYDDYIGIGPGAHGRYQSNGSRFATNTHRAPDVWLGKTAMHGHGQKSLEVIDDPTAQREALMMGLRLTQGIDHKTWPKKFGIDLADFIAPDKRAKLIAENYLFADDDFLRATPAGLQRLNAVLGYLLN